MLVMERKWNICGCLQTSLALATLVLGMLLECNANWIGGEYAAGKETKNVSCIAHDSQYTCDCAFGEENFVLPRLTGEAYELRIQNCKTLTIDPNSLDEVDVHKISFSNVEALTLLEQALSYPQRSGNGMPWIISFDKVKIKLIDSHAIKGQIKEITIANSHIELIKPFGFNILNNNAYLFKMDNVEIKRIEAQALKKLVVENIILQHCIFHTNVPSKTFYDVEVTDTFHMNNLRFKEVHTKAFSFRMISKLIITNNYFESVDAEWLEAYVTKSPLIKDNYFGATSPIAFKGIKVHRDYRSSEKLELRFSNNTVHFPHGVLPLEFNQQFLANIKQLNYNNAYACHDVDTSSQPPRPKVDFFNTYKHFIYFNQKTSSLAENGNRPLQQQQQQQHQLGVPEDYRVLSKIIDIDCQKHSYWLYIVIGVGSLLVLLTVVGVIVCWCIAKKRREQRKMDIIHPEPRTYKETQIVYQIENAGLLKTDF